VPDGGYVSRRLLQLVMPIFPDRRMFRIHDSEVHPDSPGGPLPPVGVLVSASREQLWVGSLQQDIDVRLVLEEWDGQPLLPDSWDEEGKARLYLRGHLSIDMGSAGTAVSRLRLTGGVGNYEVRVYARYREAVVQMYEELFNAHKDPLSDEFQREKRKLEGVERYLVQLWRDSLPGARSARGRRRGFRGLAGGRVLRSGARGCPGRLGGRRVVRGGTRRRLRSVCRFTVVRVERDHGVHHHRDDGHQGDREQRPDDPAPRGTEAPRPWPPKRGQPGGKPRVLGGKPPLDLGEHALLVLRQRHSVTSAIRARQLELSNYPPRREVYPIVLSLFPALF
jgi:hypothetical protein